MAVLKFCFVLSIAMAVYPFAIYPLLLAVAAKLRFRPVARGRWEGDVTVLIPAYNEVAHIERTVLNKLEQDFPPNRLQIIVVSDGSDDGTDEVVARYAGRGVTLLRRDVRQGKAAALNAAMRECRGQVVVFSDANSIFARDAISRLVENFADIEVGYVTGSLSLRHDSQNASGQGGGAYLRFENWVRTIETRVASVIGVNGGVDAIRRELYFDVPPDQITDFVLPLGVIGAGKRVVYDERATSVEEANQDGGAEFRMRVRVALRALRGLVYMRSVLDWRRNPLATFCIYSHKVVRYLSFVFLIAALGLNVVLAASEPVYSYLLLMQGILYAVALCGLSMSMPAPIRGLASIPAYFLSSNAAFAVATFRFLRGDVVATWKPRAG